MRNSQFLGSWASGEVGEALPAPGTAHEQQHGVAGCHWQGAMRMGDGNTCLEGMQGSETTCWLRRPGDTAMRSES